MTPDPPFVGTLVTPIYRYLTREGDRDLPGQKYLRVESARAGRTGECQVVCPLVRAEEHGPVLLGLLQAAAPFGNLLLRDTGEAFGSGDS